MKVIFLFIAIFSSLNSVAQDDKALYKDFYNAMFSNKNRKAEKILLKISEKDNDQFFVVVKKAEIFALNDQLDSCELYYGKVIHHLKYTAFSYVEAGFLEKKEDLYRTALINYDKIVKRYPGQPVYIANRAYFRLELGDFKGAINDHTTAIKLDTHYIDYYNRALVYSRINEIDSAILDYTTCLELNPNYGSAYLNLGFAYLKKTEYKLAVEYFNKSLEFSVSRIDQSYSINNIGYAQLMLEEYKKARGNITLSISMNPINSYAYRNLALLEIKVKNTMEACEAIDKAIELGFTEQYGNELIELKEEYCN
jgi:tetratricopeptide (TPR) repeat protein